MTTTTTDMSLILPDVLSTVGPTYATLLNAALTTIDSHNHSSGQGAQITPAGLNISSDLTFAQNNATNLRTARLFPNTSISLGVNDKTCLYALNNELYYVDGNGNNVQVTSSGSLSIGTVSSLSINDSLFTLKYFGDSSKKLQFSAVNVPTSTTRTLTFADSGSNDTVPTNASTSVLTNKSLSDTTTSFVAVGDNTKAYKILLTGATTGKTMTIASSQTNNRTLTLPDATDTLVGKATTDSLTNKSFNGTTTILAANTLNFNNSANTYYTSLAAGSNSANYAAVLPISDGSSGQVLKTDGAGNWSWTTVASNSANVAAQDSNVVFTNADVRHQSCLPTAARTYTLPTTSITQGDTWVFDNKSLFLITIQSSGSNLIGYVWPNSSISLVALVNTPTSAANWDIKYETIIPALIQANDGATTFVFSDNPYQVNTPTATRTYKLPTTGVPSGYIFKLYNQATSAANYITVQSSGANTITILPPLGEVEIMAIVATPTTAANWIVLKRISQRAAYTPTIGAGCGTVSANSAYFKILGDSLIVNGTFTTGTVSNAVGSISLPAGITIDSTKISLANTTSGNGSVLGYYAQMSATVKNNIGQILSATGTSTSLVYIGFSETTGAGSPLLMSNISGGSLESSQVISYTFEVPIL